MKPPKQIYLQWYGDETDPGERRDIDRDPNATGTNMEVGWRADKINKHDVRYVRADVAEARIRKLPKLVYPSAADLARQWIEGNDE